MDAVLLPHERGGAEVDLVLERGDERSAVEARASTPPRVTRGFFEEADDIGATRRYVVAPLPAPGSYPLRRDTTVATPDAIVGELRR